MMVNKKTSHFKNTLRESFRMALEAIRDNKLRSMLTLLGITIGVFSVIGVMTAIRTLESSVASGLNVFGTNTFNISKRPTIQFGHGGRWKYRNRPNITYQLYEDLRDRAILPLHVSAYDSKYGVTVKYKDKQATKNIEVAGADEYTVRTLNTNISDGRNFSRDDVLHMRKTALIGQDAITQLFPFKDPLNKQITVDGIKFRIIGIIEEKGAMFGESQDNIIAIPLSTHLQMFGGRRRNIEITVEAPSEELYDQTRDEVIGILRTLRKVPPGEDNNFELTSNEEILDELAPFTDGIKLFAFSVSVIALIVAGIGIMNIMLVSVSERIKEIGIRKAIGATRRDILTQFLTEAVFLSEFGGIAGIILGVAGGNVVAAIFNIPAVIPLDWAFIGLAVCSVIGIGFGIYPAWKAANMDPIESLRYE
jgi:putative ABC transport system permease protein